MRHPTTIKRLVVMMAKKGIPYADITRETGLPSSTISSWAVAEGIRRHRRGERTVEDNDARLF